MLNGKLIIPIAAVMLAMLAVARISPSNASAQYPTPRGALLCTSGVITAQSNSSFQFVATIVDIQGAPVPGVTVFFTVASTSGASLSTNNAQTDGNGQAFVNVYTGTGGGQIIVTATADQFVCRAVVNVPPEVPNIVCHIVNLTYQFNYQYQFVVMLRSTTTILVGQTVHFSIISTGGGASLMQYAAVTDGNGQAIVNFNVLPTSGSVTVTANYNGAVCPATLNVPPPPPQIVVQPPPPQLITHFPPPQYIAPPQTGDAGLASRQSSSDGAAEAAVAVVMLTMVGGIAWVARRGHEVHDVTQ